MITQASLGTPGRVGQEVIGGISSPLQTVPTGRQQAGLAMATEAAWLLGGPWPQRRVPRAVWAAALRERGTGCPGVRGKDAWALLTLEYVSG